MGRPNCKTQNDFIMSRANSAVSKHSHLTSSWAFEDGGVDAPPAIQPAQAQPELVAAGVVRVHEGICFGDDITSVPVRRAAPAPIPEAADHVPRGASSHLQSSITLG